MDDLRSRRIMGYGKLFSLYVTYENHSFDLKLGITLGVRTKLMVKVNMNLKVSDHPIQIDH